MAKKDIYKIDNYFIRIGIISIILAGIPLFADPRTRSDLTIIDGSTLTFEDFEGRTLEQIQEEKGSEAEITVNEFPLYRTIFFANGILLLIIGLVYRSKEKKIIAVWDALEQSGEAKVTNLTQALGLSRQFIVNHLKEINAQQNAYYVFDIESDKIVDGKLMAEYSLTTNCSGCGNTIEATVSLHDIKSIKCSYCGTALSSAELNKLKQEALASRKIEEKSDGFSVGTFILLLIFFWPAAIVYLIIKKSKAAKAQQERILNLVGQTTSG